MSTADLLAVLRVARDNGSVHQAIHDGSEHAVLHAATWNLIQIVHDSNGVVAGARWAVEQASHTQQATDLYLQLTPAGADHLDAA